MNYIIYLDNTGLKAYTNVSPSEFEAFRASLAPQDILYHNDNFYPENVRPEIADVLPIFVKSMLRQWMGSATFVAPTPKKVEQVEEPVAAPKPKKKATKKKKENTNDQ